MVRISPFHGGHTGSNPVRTTTSRDRAVVAYKAHNLGVGGSSPPPATMIPNGNQIFNLTHSYYMKNILAMLAIAAAAVACTTSEEEMVVEEVVVDSTMVETTDLTDETLEVAEEVTAEGEIASEE